jgi:hypothetical protein
VVHQGTKQLTAIRRAWPSVVMPTWFLNNELISNLILFCRHLFLRIQGLSFFASLIPAM